MYHHVDATYHSIQFFLQGLPSQNIVPQPAGCYDIAIVHKKSKGSMCLPQNFLCIIIATCCHNMHYEENVVTTMILPRTYNMWLLLPVTKIQNSIWETKHLSSCQLSLQYIYL